MTNKGYPGYAPTGPLELQNMQSRDQLAAAVRARGAHNMTGSMSGSDNLTAVGAGADGAAGNLNTM